MTQDNGHLHSTPAGEDRPAAVSLTLQFDRALVRAAGDSVRYLVADVQAAPAPAAPDDASRPRRSLNLGLVIDASGSMAGRPLDAAREAAVRVAEALGPRDRLSVLTFAGETRVHVTALPMDARGHELARNAIRSIHSRGNTDLGAGYIHGAQLVADEMERGATDHAHVILLSDGRANAGITDPAELAGIASGLRERGLFTSTVGIGDGYSTTQIQALADAGGGRLHDAYTPDEIATVVLGELDEAFGSAVENVRLELKVPAGAVEFELLGSYHEEIGPGLRSVVVGSLAHGAGRQLAFKVKTAPGAVGAELRFEARLLWQVQGSTEQHAGPWTVATLTLVEDGQNLAQPRDPELALAVATLWHSYVVLTGSRMNRTRDARRSEWFQTQLHHFERYCRDLPGTHKLCEELRYLAQRIDRYWGERYIKDREIYEMKRSKGQREHSPRDKSSLTMPNSPDVR